MGEVQEMCTHFTAELSFEREAYMMDTVAALMSPLWLPSYHPYLYLVATPMVT